VGLRELMEGAIVAAPVGGVRGLGVVVGASEEGKSPRDIKGGEEGRPEVR
jgi:hypothetical protein